MRGIRIKLSVFEFDVLKDLLESRIKQGSLIDPNKSSIVVVALKNILSQFETKLNKANERKEQ